jgi:SAM-dependent methyltransferase
VTTSDDGRRAHWEDVYSSKGVDEVSWFQREPEVSLRLVAGAPGSVVDVGAGASVLVDRLLAAGRTDVTLLDLSSAALAVTRERLGPAADGVTFVAADVVGWDPGRTFDCWHDRAVFHFLTDPARQAAYVATAGRLVAPGGAVVLGTFAADGPTQCSGLPTARHEPADLASQFAHDFDLEHAEHETHRTPWGAEQHFTWVVLRRR